MAKRSPRLIFTEEERALPKLERIVRKADRAAVKLEKAEAKIPKKPVKVKKRVVDSESGKVTTRLFFEEEDKKRPPSKLAHAARKAPPDTVRSAVHRKLREEGGDNPGTEAANTLTETAERTGLWAWRDSADPAAPLVPLRGDVRFRDVSFGYLPGQTTLHDVTLYAKPGQKIAFVGSTGAGKTTITNLINRFYDITSGTITYDGIDVRKIRKSDLRRSLGVVLQDTHLFTGTVADNIRFGKLDATDEEIIAAAKIANAHSFIERLPQGYNTMVSGDGANLSQGQRQLLAIARAAVADPPVLILDEATSSIDTRTEALIEKGMDRLMEGRTVFVIAHRLSTVRNSNAIIVLEHGGIVERGSHDELLAQKGEYYQLYNGMFELA